MLFCTSAGHSFSLPWEAEQTAGEIKELILGKLSLPVSVTFSLIYKGEEISESQTKAEIKIPQDALIYTTLSVPPSKRRKLSLPSPEKEEEIKEIEDIPAAVNPQALLSLLMPSIIPSGSPIEVPILGPEDETNLELLKSMGFEEEKAKEAYLRAHKNFDVALDALLSS